MFSRIRTVLLVTGGFILSFIDRIKIRLRKRVKTLRTDGVNLFKHMESKQYENSDDRTN